MTRHDEAVSSVVSAVLLFALFSTAFLMWTITTLPEWVEAREATHADLTRAEMAGMQAVLEQMASSGDAGPVTRTFDLGPDPVAFLQRTPTLGTLSIEEGLNITGTFTNAALHVQGQAAAGVPDEPLGSAMGDVAALEFLFLRYSSSGLGAGDYAYVQLTATDGTDSVTARIIQTDASIGPYPRTVCAGGELRSEVTSVAGAVQEQVLQCDLDTDVSGHRIDLTEDRIGIATALGDLEAGYSVTWTSFASTGSAALSTYSAVWRDSDGMTRVAGTGQATTYSLDEASQSLVMDTRAQHLAQQDIVWEGGGVIVAQASGMAVALPPTLTLDVSGTEGALRWTLVTLSGDGSASGDEVPVAMRMVRSTDIILSVDTADFTLDGPRAAAWRDHIDDLVALGGVADVTTGGTAQSATVTLGDSTVTRWTLHLRIIEAALELA